MPDATQAASGSDVIVIGAGLSGLMAAAQAIDAGAKVRVIAQGWGQQIVAPGWISVCDRADDDVIAEVRGYAAIHPDHPYALAEVDAMVRGLDGFRARMKELGLPYDMRRKDGHNMRLISALGVIQRAMIAPRGIAASDWTDVTKPILLVGIKGWRDFYAKLAAGNLRSQGVEAQAIEVNVPETPTHWDRWPNDLARSFDNLEFRTAIVKQVQPHAKNYEKIGFPAVLGMDQHMTVLDEFSAALGRPVFEIPTLPPSIPGMRLSSRMRRWMLRQGARVQIGHPVVHAHVENGRCVSVDVEALGHTNTFYADQVILATGGLYNGGILSDDTGCLWEPIFDLPVQTPDGEGREQWFGDHLLQERGHAIHRQAGLRVDKQMRPLDADGAPVLENVYAIGHLLAGFNPLTDGCAEGIDLATAYKAIRVALALSD